MDKFVETVGRGAGSLRRLRQRQGPGHGLLRRQHRHRAVELRPALRDERQLLRHHVRAVDRRARSTWSPARPTASPPTSAGGARASSGTVIGDPQPTGDDCDTRDTSASIDPSNKNIGDLLNAKRRHLGLVPGRLRRLHAPRHTNVGGVVEQGLHPAPRAVPVLRQHGQPQPHCRRPRSAEIGHAGPANHQYDLTDFWAARRRRQHAGGQLPQGGRLPGRPRRLLRPARRAALPRRDDQPAAADARTGRAPRSSSPTTTPTAGTTTRWARSSTSPATRRTTRSPATGTCGTNPARIAGGYQDRCGYGPRLPLLVISPYAKRNFVDHTRHRPDLDPALHRGQLEHRAGSATTPSTRRPDR